jgi:hypothetical protein
MGKRFNAAFQSLIGIVHFVLMLFSARSNNLSKTSSLGNEIEFFELTPTIERQQAIG